MEPGRWSDRVPSSATIRRVKTKLSWFQPATKPLPLSRPACDDAWREYMAKRCSGNEFASVTSVTQCFLSAGTAIADNATAVHNAVHKPASTSDGVPTAATNKAPKDGSIIAIVSAITDAAAGKRNRT